MTRKIVLEGIPEYDNEGNGGFAEWANLKTDEDSFDLLALFRMTDLSDISDCSAWENCKVRVTVEILELRNSENEEVRVCDE